MWTHLVLFEMGFRADTTDAEGTAVNSQDFVVDIIGQDFLDTPDPSVCERRDVDETYGRYTKFDIVNARQNVEWRGSVKDIPNSGFARWLKHLQHECPGNKDSVALETGKALYANKVWERKRYDAFEFHVAYEAT